MLLLILFFQLTISQSICIDQTNGCAICESNELNELIEINKEIEQSESNELIQT